jgi:hypothetical protein
MMTTRTPAAIAPDQQIRSLIRGWVKGTQIGPFMLLAPLGPGGTETVSQMTTRSGDNNLS